MTAEAVGLRADDPQGYLTISEVVKLPPKVEGSPTAAHFWERVDASAGPDDCWPWTTSRFDTGYGCVWADGKAQKAHRIAWRLVNGEIPAKVRILHRCDNPPCCNPNHLFAGSSRDNTADMDAKGRRVTSYRKLHAGAVADIRISHLAGVTLQTLADRYGVTVVAIWKVVHRETWKHVA